MCVFHFVIYFVICVVFRALCLSLCSYFVISVASYLYFVRYLVLYCVMWFL